MKRILPAIFAASVLAFLLAQLIHPAIPSGLATNEIHVPANVKAVLEKDCYSCHSDERRLAWFDEMQPAYGLVRKDILDARSRLNFSTIGTQPEAAQKGALYEAVAMMQLEAMPLPRYLRLHPEATVTAQDLDAIKEYLSPWSSPIPLAAADNSANNSADISPVAAKLSGIQPTLNGILYDGDWRKWKLLAVTDRGDNRQFRMILGNDIAVKAAREGNVHPWPDGTKFAKLAWQQQQTSGGLVIPGKFWQIEMMIKDASRFRDTDGWGWARWRGTDLKPYGKDATFVNECTGCHLPVRGNDYVYTQPFSPASMSGQEVLNNAAVRFPKELAFNPLEWAPSTIFSDPQKQTISVLFVTPKNTDSGTGSNPSGSDMALVTWTERDDPHWFGARIADSVVSVEVVRPGAENQLEYRRFAEAGTDSATTIAAKDARSRLIAGLHAAQLP